MPAIVSFFADLLRVVEHLFVMSVLLFACVLLLGRIGDKFVTWTNSRRLRIDFSPHESRGWKP